MFEGAKPAWKYVRENWIDGSRDWLNENIGLLDSLITRMRENNPFKKKPEQPSE